jgi:hypothetical protein
MLDELCIAHRRQNHLRLEVLTCSYFKVLQPQLLSMLLHKSSVGCCIRPHAVVAVRHYKLQRPLLLQV